MADARVRRARLRRRVPRARTTSPTSTPGGRTAARRGRRTSAGASTTRSRRRASPQHARSGVDLQGEALLRPRAADHRLRPLSCSLPAGVRPYFERAPLAALFLGISSGFTFAMIGATLTTRLAQHGITKSAVTAFALTFLAYNFKFLWAPIVDNVRLPLIGRFGQRRSWLWLVGVLVMAAVAFLGIADPERVAATWSRSPRSRSAWPARPSTSSSTPTASSCSSRASSASAPACRSTAGASARRRPARSRWCSRRASAGPPPTSPARLFALPAMLVGVVMGEPARHREPAGRTA